MAESAENTAVLYLNPTDYMRDDYLKNALLVISDPNILINVISLRVKQLRRGSRPLVESLEKLSPEDTALREVAEGKITYQLATAEELARL
ncbi:DNA-directed RNA polymerase subunit omega [Rariglobus hedericola]|nr:DNA-directed RNA polymerase subunit omega [Rariglobus hedericola]